MLASHIRSHFVIPLSEALCEMLVVRLLVFHCLLLKKSTPPELLTASQCIRYLCDLSNQMHPALI